MGLLFLMPLYIFQPDGVNLWLVKLWLSDRTEFMPCIHRFKYTYSSRTLLSDWCFSYKYGNHRSTTSGCTNWSLRGEQSVSLSHIKAYYIIFQILNGMHKRRNDLNIFIYLTFEKTGIPQCSIQPAPEVSELFSTNIWIENSSVIWFNTSCCSSLVDLRILIPCRHGNIFLLFFFPFITHIAQSWSLFLQFSFSYFSSSWYLGP